MRNQKVLDEIRDALLNNDTEQYLNKVKELQSSFSINAVPKMKLKYVNKSQNKIDYAKEGDSGFDLRANLDTDQITIESGEYKLVPTGIYFEIPTGFEIQIRSRSGLAAKHGVAVLNSPGTIDSGYRGEIQVILINHGKNPFVIQNGDRIAQAVYASVLAKHIVDLEEVPEISDNTERGATGFGSSGVK